MREVLEFLGFASTMVAVFYVAMYITWEIVTRIVDNEEEEDYIITKDGEKIPYDEDTQE